MRNYPKDGDKLSPLKITPREQVRYSAKINAYGAILAGYRAFFVKSLSLKKKTKSIQLTMITSFGVAKGKHSSIVQSQVTLDDLFS